ncbi:MAG: hypothetical protein ACK4WJ_03235 [Endomicrobiia bacterium]
MKKNINFIFFLLSFNSLVLCEVYDQNSKINLILNYLEGGNFNQAEKIINDEKDDNFKTYFYSIYHLYKGDYVLAEEYIKKIQNGHRNYFFFDYIIKINNIINTYEAHESQHFKVFLKGRDVILKDFILENLEKIYDIYGKIFNYYPEEKIRVEVYNTKQEFYFATTLGEEIVKKSGVVGICKFNKIMIISPENLPLGYRWIDTLAHEYIHFILNRKTSYNYPLYLHEGTARYFDTIYRSSFPMCFTAGNLKLLVEAKKNNKLINFDEMKGSLVYLDTIDKIELAFVELASFVEFLVKNFGIEKFVKFIEEYDSKNEKKLYKEIFGKEYEEIKLLWIKTIDEKEKYITLYPGALADLKINTATDESSLIGLDLENYIKLGDKFLSLKNYKSALFQYNKAKEIEPYNPVVLSRIGKIYLLMQKYDECEEILKKCILVNPNFVTAYEILLKNYYEKGDYEKVLEVFKSVIEINPFNYEIRKIVAEIYADLGKTKEALEEYKIVKVLQPQNKEVDSIINSLENYLKIKYRK